MNLDSPQPEDPNPQEIWAYTCLTMEKWLKPKYHQVFLDDRIASTNGFRCTGNGGVHYYILSGVANNSATSYHIEETLQNASKIISGFNKLTVCFVVDSLGVGNRLLNQIEHMDNFATINNLYISLVIKNSDPLGPLSFHDGILFSSVNVHRRSAGERNLPAQNSVVA